MRSKNDKISLKLQFYLVLYISVKRKSVKHNDENNDPSKDTEAAYSDIKETREDVPAPSAIIRCAHCFYKPNIRRPDG